MIIWFIYCILYIENVPHAKSFFSWQKHNFDCLQLLCFGHPIFLFTKRQQSFIPNYYITSIELKFYNQQQNGEMSLHINHISYHRILEQQLPLSLYINMCWRQTYLIAGYAVCTLANAHICWWCCTFVAGASIDWNYKIPQAKDLFQSILVFSKTNLRVLKNRSKQI